MLSKIRFYDDTLLCIHLMEGFNPLTSQHPQNGKANMHEDRASAQGHAE